MQEMWAAGDVRCKRRLQEICAAGCEMQEMCRAPQDMRCRMSAAGWALQDVSTSALQEMCTAGDASRRRCALQDVRSSVPQDVRSRRCVPQDGRCRRGYAQIFAAGDVRT
ncbi:unnamed protein product [Pleuronectes platessa]|uniref:Uncharacterized protein n=1 Tax=Pleuronectes platessa TaxID=8262 RepID=A0A9N7U0D1_PLEPL|nr:unnamed protein product [Pleuronectes platessa]